MPTISAWHQPLAPRKTTWDGAFMKPRRVDAKGVERAKTVAVVSDQLTEPVLWGGGRSDPCGECGREC